MLRVALFGLALLLAAGAGWMVKIYLSAQRAQLEELRAQQQPKPVSLTDVLVAVDAIELSTPITSSNLRWQPWPDDNLNDHYITRKNRPDAIAKLTGAAARQRLFAGEPITEEKLVLKQEGGFLAAMLPGGVRAITLKVDEASGIGGLLLPGDRVDVILTHDVPASRSDQAGSMPDMTKHFVSETIVHDIQVVAIDQDMRHDEKSPKVGKTATLAVDAGQAEAIALGRVMGTLTLSLRSSFGGQNAEQLKQSYTSSTDISGALRAATARRPPDAASSAPTYSVTVIRGLASETVNLRPPTDR